MLLASLVACLPLLSMSAENPAAGPAQVFIDPAGDDSTGDGSAGNPFRSPQKAVDSVSPGGTVFLRPGAYPFQTVISTPVQFRVDGVGIAVVGPGSSSGAIFRVVGADDVTFDGLRIVGDSSSIGVQILSGADRVSLTDCEFDGHGLDAIRVDGSPSSGHSVTGCTFTRIFNPVFGAGIPSSAISVQAAASIEVVRCRFSTCDVGIRLRGSDLARVVDCEFVDLFHPAILAVDSDDLVVEDVRLTRCAHLPTPSSRTLPLEELGAISLTLFSDRAVVRRAHVEDCGGYLGVDSFLPPAATLYDGLFAIAIQDSSDTRIEDSSLHRNRFGGVYVTGASPGTAILRCNLVANGFDNGVGEDTALFTGGLSITATDNFWGLPQGPTNDGAGNGNGVDGGGSVAIVPVRTQPFRSVFSGFTEQAILSTGTRVVDVLALDIDGDLRDDVVTAEDVDGTISVYLNTTLGLTARTVLPIGGRPVAVAAGMVDADAEFDLLVLDEASDELVVLLGDGAGGFVVDQRLPVLRVPRRLRVADLDGVAGDEVVVACQGDPLQPGGLVRFDNDGTGVLTSSSMAGTSAATDVALLDLNADSALEIVAFDVAPAGPGLRAYSNSGSGTFGAPTSVAVDAHPVVDGALHVTNVDGGADDLVVASYSLPFPGTTRIRLFRGTGTGALAPPTMLDEQLGPVQLDSADFDLSGKRSVVTINPANRDLVVIGAIEPDTTPFFSYAQQLTGLPLAGATGAFVDGQVADLVVANPQTQTIQVLRGRGPSEVTFYGNTCPGSTGVVEPGYHSLAEIGSSTFALTFENAPADAPAVLFFSSTPVAVALGSGCELLVDPVLLAIPTSADSTGFGVIPISIPFKIMSPGLLVYFQFFVIDDGAPVLGIASATRGIRVLVGG